MNTVCSKCGKPVYFAERKTSLGKNWHPSCLKCEECGKILAPGAHAEHKGLPYCHRPCYAALFGPQMVGYGSNVHSPANYRKSGDHGTLYNEELPSLAPKMVYEVHMNAKKSEVIRRKPKVCSSQTVLPSVEPDLEELSSIPQFDSETQELLQKIKDFNNFYEGKKKQSLSANTNSPDLVIQGPLRIYWGIFKPIQLQRCDNVPSNLHQTNWRHSFIPGDVHQGKGDNHVNNNSFLQAAEEPSRSTSSRVPDLLENLPKLSLEEPSSPSHANKGFDDSIIQTPPDGVVMRRKNIKKFNTVAYRGDSRPNKWKRASINGHIYNFDTRVFTPVMGSCTSVTVDSTYSTPDVIKTLLEKFKIENQPNEYSLYLVTENGGEKLLRDTDIPLLERVALGPDEVSKAKIFLRDKVATPRKTSLVQLAVPDVVVEEEEVEEPVPKPEPRLPQEVEQLLSIPEPVLRGILQKFIKDEETDIQNIRARFSVAKKRIKEELAKIQTKM
ncbi:ras association domain-containing protein 2-like [Mizuhopecten yessoensis]|uniref:Ras association domain-containing protein 2 n=1 Tax=Mizuhopecten yessoensis TaxID=6573 RepID=A0A210QI73_MIZYE|nr:ras association domain-containing protein 2-like [Mizuhopecten yessoensis]OWF48488.1 Ras association domain-containing protein 2 [Mizuhopecten yessoensis]